MKRVEQKVKASIKAIVVIFMKRSLLLKINEPILMVSDGSSFGISSGSSVSLSRTIGRMYLLSQRS